MKTYRALVTALWRSQRRDPVGLFFSFAFAPLLVLILGVIFGNEPRPEFDGRGFLDTTLPAFASLVLAMTGVLQLPVAMLTLRDSGALRRLSLTPLRPPHRGHTRRSVALSVGPGPMRTHANAAIRTDCAPTTLNKTAWHPWAGTQSNLRSSAPNR